MPKRRPVQLTDRVAELEASLDGWAREQGLIKPHEELRLTVNIKRKDGVSPKKFELEPTFPVTLTGKDWFDMLEHFSRDAQAKAIVQKMADNGNRPVSRRYLVRSPVYWAVLGRINRSLWGAGLPFRLHSDEVERDVLVQFQSIIPPTP